MAIININFATTLVYMVVLLPVVLCQVPATLTLERRFPINQEVELSEVSERDFIRHSRKMAESSGLVDFPVGGSLMHVGLYLTKIRLGSPPKEFYVVIDSGSEALWVSCTSCSSCPSSSGLHIKLTTFDTSSSSTASSIACSDQRCHPNSLIYDSFCSSHHSNQCSYSIRYAEGSSAAGYFVEDVMHLERVVGKSVVSTTKASVVFGCSTSLTGNLTETATAVDGILGLGQRGISVVSQLFSQDITPNAFSHCLKGSDSGGGILVFGYVVEPNLVYTPLLPSKSAYRVDMRSIAVNGKNFPINPAVFSMSDSQETLIDSGTTLAYLPKEVYDPFVNAITQAVSQSAHLFHSKGYECYFSSSRLQISQTFPSVTLNFSGGALMILKPEDYLLTLKLEDGAPTWCIGFRKSNSRNYTLLGELVLKDKIVTYDLVGRRIGWAEYDCSSAVNVSTNSSSGMSEFVNARRIGGTSSKHDASVKLIPISIIIFIVNIIIL